jgi:hypothetical protein
MSALALASYRDFTEYFPMGRTSINLFEVLVLQARWASSSSKPLAEVLNAVLSSVPSTFWFYTLHSRIHYNHTLLICQEMGLGNEDVLAATRSLAKDSVLTVSSSSPSKASEIAQIFSAIFDLWSFCRRGRCSCVQEPTILSEIDSVSS